MKVVFKGSLAEVRRQADEWKAAHPNARITFPGAPVRGGLRDLEDVFLKADWTYTIEYEPGE